MKVPKELLDKVESAHNLLLEDENIKVIPLAEVELYFQNARTEQEKCCIDCKHFRSELHNGYPYEYCSNLDLQIYDMTEFYCQRFEKP